jgi:hypothetical protein
LKVYYGISLSKAKKIYKTYLAWIWSQHTHQSYFIK